MRRPALPHRHRAVAEIPWPSWPAVVLRPRGRTPRTSAAEFGGSIDRPSEAWVNRAVHERPTTDRVPAAAAPQRELARLIDGYLTTQLLYVAAKLGVADVLADGPRTGREVAEAVGADPDALTRMLRGLALEDVLAEAATAASPSPRSATPARACRARSADDPRARRGATGRPPPGCSHRSIEGGTPSSTSTASASSTTSPPTRSARPPSRPRWPAGASARPPTSSRSTTSAGSAARRRRRGLRRPARGGPPCVAWAARRPHRSTGGVELADAVSRLPGWRIAVGTCRATSSPPCRRAPTPTCSRASSTTGTTPTRGRVLATCRAAMSDDARLLLVEAIMPERAHDAPEAIRMDLHMLMLLRARERTEAPVPRPARRRGHATCAGSSQPGPPPGLSVLEATVASAALRARPLAGAVRSTSPMLSITTKSPLRAARPGRARALGRGSGPDRRAGSPPRDPGAVPRAALRRPASLWCPALPARREGRLLLPQRPAARDHRPRGRRAPRRHPRPRGRRASSPTPPQPPATSSRPATIADVIEREAREAGAAM